MVEEDGYYETAFKVIGVSIFALVVIVVTYNTIVANEYPFLSNEDSVNLTVQSVYVERSSAYVTFEGNRKYHLHWAQNFNYKDFPNLSALISPGDQISKRKLSDTLKVNHSGKDYVYVLKRAIERK